MLSAQKHTALVVTPNGVRKTTKVATVFDVVDDVESRPKGKPILITPAMEDAFVKSLNDGYSRKGAGWGFDRIRKRLSAEGHNLTRGAYNILCNKHDSRGIGLRKKHTRTGRFPMGTPGAGIVGEDGEEAVACVPVLMPPCSSPSPSPSFSTPSAAASPSPSPSVRPRGRVGDDGPAETSLVVVVRPPPVHTIRSLVDRDKSWRVSWDYGIGCPVINRPISWESSPSPSPPLAPSMPALGPAFGDGSTAGAKRRLVSTVVRTLIGLGAMGAGQMFAHRLNEGYSTYGSFTAAGEIFDPINWGCYGVGDRAVVSSLNIRGPVVVHDYNTWVQLITARNPWKADLPGSQNRPHAYAPTSRPFVFYAVFRRSMYIPDEEEEEEEERARVAVVVKREGEGVAVVPGAVIKAERVIRNGFYDDDPLRCFVLRHGCRSYEEVRTLQGAPSRHRHADDEDGDDHGQGPGSHRQPSWDRYTLRYEGSSPLIYISVESLAKLLDDESQTRGFLRLGLEPITLLDMPEEVERLRSYFSGTPHDVVRFERPCARPPSDPDAFVD